MRAGTGAKQVRRLKGKAYEKKESEVASPIGWLQFLRQ
jgi:hypothetical protein